MACSPANTRHQSNVEPMLGHSLRRRHNICSTLGRCLVFAGSVRDCGASDHMPLGGNCLNTGLPEHVNASRQINRFHAMRRQLYFRSIVAVQLYLTFPKCSTVLVSIHRTITNHAEKNDTRAYIVSSRVCKADKW